MSTRDGTPFRTPQVSRHDVVLAVIPLAFLSSLAVGDLLSIAPRVALAVGSIVGALAVYDALFRNPPRDGSGP